MISQVPDPVLSRVRGASVFSLIPAPVVAGVDASDFEFPHRFRLLQTPIGDFAAGPLSQLNLIAVVAAIAIGFIAWQAWSNRPRVANGQERPTTAVPDILHPAQAGALASANVSDAHMEATILELARRGAIQIEPDPDDDGNVRIRLLDTSAARHAFETILLDLLQRRAREDVVGYRGLNRLRAEWSPARRQLRAEMEERGWFNPNSRRNRLPLFAAGLIGILFAAGMIVTAIVAGNGWPVIGAFLVGSVGIVVLGMGSIYPSTTPEGEAEAIKWRGLRTGLARARIENDPSIDLDDVFPYVVAFNMAATFNRYLRRSSQRGYVPAWFGPDTDVSTWPDGWHDYWTSLHTALAPTDTANTRAPGGTTFQRWVTGGRQ